MRRRPAVCLIAAAVLGCMAVAAPATAYLAAVTVNKCLQGKLKDDGKAAAAYTRCHAKNTAKPDPGRFAACTAKASGKATTAFGKLDLKFPGACPGGNGDGGARDTDVAAFANDLNTNTAIGNAPGRCDAAKQRCVGRYLAAIGKCYSKAAAKTGAVDNAVGGCTDKAAHKLADGAKGCLDKAAAANDCTNAGSQAAALQGMTNTFLQGEVCALDPSNPACGTAAPTPTDTSNLTPTATAATPTLVATPTSTLAAATTCGQPGDTGNDLGIGRYCTAHSDCAGQPADICASAFNVSLPPVCIVAPCDGTTNCGAGASCACGALGCGCLPNACGTGLTPTPHPPLVVNAVDYGTVCNGATVNDGAIAAGTTTLTSASAPFGAEDVGKPILVVAAGPEIISANLYRMPLRTQIVQVVDTATVTLADAATRTVSGAEVVWGSDDTAALQRAIDAVADGGGTVNVPVGRCLVDGLTMPCANRAQCPWGPQQRSYNGIWIQGAGRDLTILQSIEPTSGRSVLEVGLSALGPDRITGVKISGIHFRQVLNKTGLTAKAVLMENTDGAEVFASEFSNNSYECLVMGDLRWNVHDNRAEACGKGGPLYELPTSALNLSGDDAIESTNTVTDSGQGTEVGGHRTQVVNNVFDGALITTPSLVSTELFANGSIAINVGSNGSGIADFTISGNTVHLWNSGVQIGNSLGVLHTVSILNNVFDECGYSVTLAGGRESHCPLDNAACGPSNQCSCPSNQQCGDGSACSPGSECPTSCGFCTKPFGTFCQTDGSCSAVSCGPGGICPDGSLCPMSGTCPEYPPACTGLYANALDEPDAVVHGTSVVRGNSFLRQRAVPFDIQADFFGGTTPQELEWGRESWLIQDNTIQFDTMSCEGYTQILCQSQADCDAVGRPCILLPAIGFSPGQYGLDSGPFIPHTEITNLTITAPAYAATTVPVPGVLGHKLLLLGDTARAKVILNNVTANYPWQIVQNPTNPAENYIPANTPYSDPP